MDLQRADAGREIDDRPADAALRSAFISSMHAQAQCQIEHQRAEFDQQIAVARAAIGRPRDASSARRLQPTGAPAPAGPMADRRRRSAPCRPARNWPSLPQIGTRRSHRADEAAKARAVGAEDDRHVAGEIDRADRRRRCRGCWTGAARPRRRPARAQRGFGPIRRTPVRARVVMHLVASPQNSSRCRPSVKKSGAPCGP